MFRGLGLRGNLEALPSLHAKSLKPLRPRGFVRGIAGLSIGDVEYRGLNNAILMVPY